MCGKTTTQNLPTAALQTYIHLLQHIKYSMFVENNAICEEMVLFMQIMNSSHCVDS